MSNMENAMMKWTEADSMKFVYHYRNHECLWNTKSEFYNVQEARNEAYADLAVKMGMTEFDAGVVEKTLTNLRAHYNSELEKVRMYKQMGQEYKPTLYWFNEMDAFLGKENKNQHSKQEVIPGNIISNRSSNYENVFVKEEPGGNTTPIVHLPVSNHNTSKQGCYSIYRNEDPCRETLPISLPEAKSTGPKQKKNYSQATIPRKRKWPMDEEEENTDRENPDKSIPKKSVASDAEGSKRKASTGDAFDIFGKRVAGQLRMLTLSGAYRAETKIQAILEEERMRDLKNGYSPSMEALGSSPVVSGNVEDCPKDDTGQVAWSSSNDTSMPNEDEASDPYVLDTSTMEGQSRPRKIIHSQAKEIIYNVNKYFLAEKANGGPIIDPSKSVARTAKATNTSKSTVLRVCGKLNKACDTLPPREREKFIKQHLSSSSPRRNRIATVTNLDEFDKQVLRRTILGFYERKEIPTLRKVQEEVKENTSFSGCIESLNKVLKQIGFKCAAIQGRKLLMERSDVVAARTSFLRETKKLKQSCHPIVYLDETSLIVQHLNKRAPSACSRLIIIHAGTKDGFIRNAELVIQAQNSTDYYKKINSTIFEEWFKNQLLPNIPSDSVITSHHSLKLDNLPNMLWRKAKIRDWLISKGFHPSDDMLKSELLEHSKKYNGNSKSYVIDTVAEEAGHRVLRIPPYHCHYNPIELIWAQVKSYIAGKNISTLANMKLHVEEALSRVTPQDWMQAVKDVEQLQELDAVQDIAVDRFVDSLGITSMCENTDDEDSD